MEASPSRLSPNRKTPKSASSSSIASMPDSVLFEIFSKTSNPKEMSNLCATNRAYAAFCNQHREQLNKAQLIRRFPNFEKFFKEPLTFMNTMIYLGMDISELAELGATQYMVKRLLNRSKSWEDQFESIRVFTTMFDADPNEALVCVAEHKLHVVSNHAKSLENFKQLLRFIKTMAPRLALDARIFMHLLQDHTTNVVDYVHLMLPLYQRLPASVIAKAFMNPRISDIGMLWSFLILLDPATVNEAVNGSGEQLLQVLLEKEQWGVPSDTLSVQQSRKDRFLLHLLSVKQLDINATSKFSWTALHTAAFIDHTPLISEEILLKIIQLKPDVNIRNNHGWTPTHIAFNNKTRIFPEKAWLELLKLQPDLNIQLPEKFWGRTPAHLAFANKTVTEKVLLEVLKHELNLSIKSGDGKNYLYYGLANVHGNITENVQLKLLDMSRDIMLFEKADDGKDAVYCAFDNQNTSERVLRKIMSIVPIDVNKLYTFKDVIDDDNDSDNDSDSDDDDVRTESLLDVIKRRNRTHLIEAVRSPAASPSSGGRRRKNIKKL